MAWRMAVIPLLLTLAVPARSATRGERTVRSGPSFDRADLPVSLLDLDARTGFEPVIPTLEPEASFSAPPLPEGAFRTDEANTIYVAETASRSAVQIKVGRESKRTLFETLRGAADVAETAPTGVASGFMWDGSGHIVTNAHVAEHKGLLSVVLNDGTEVPAALVGSYPRFDIAVIKIAPEAGQLTPVVAGDSDRVQRGQKALVIGSPMGYVNTVSRGIISGVAREIQGIAGTIRGMLQTDAAMNRGNSGGLLLDCWARLVGMPTAIVTPCGAGGNVGIGFAVPVNLIKEIVPRLIRHGNIPYPGLGLVPMAGDHGGVGIEKVLPGSDAARAGVTAETRRSRSMHPLEALGFGVVVMGDSGKAGDVITRIGDTPIKDLKDYYDALDRYKIGEEVDVLFSGDAGTKKVRIKLAAAP